VQSNTAPAVRQTTRLETTAPFGQATLILDETSKAIILFGGLASILAFLGRIGYAREVERHPPFPVPGSPNATLLGLPPCLGGSEIVSCGRATRRFRACRITPLSKSRARSG
jgi:hypothetical protein